MRGMASGHLVETSISYLHFMLLALYGQSFIFRGASFDCGSVLVQWSAFILAATPSGPLSGQRGHLKAFSPLQLETMSLCTLQRDFKGSSARGGVEIHPSCHSLHMMLHGSGHLSCSRETLKQCDALQCLPTRLRIIFR